jgi:hypothetical protein
MRLDSPDLANGERVGGLRMWPAAHPRIFLERGEILSFSIRVWIEDPAKAPISVTTDKPGVIVHVAEKPASDSQTSSGLPPNAVTTAVRTESSGSGFWLDVKLGPVDKAGVFRAPLTIPDGFKEFTGTSGAMPDVTLVVVDSSFAITPPTLNLGAISIATLANSPAPVGTLNVRKLFGSFKLESVTSGLPGLSFDVRTIINDKNYIIRIRVDPGKGLSPSAIDSSILIMTDDPKHLIIEVPIKAVIVP